MPEIEWIPCGNVNCYIVRGDDGSILVDTARTKYRERILERCRQEEIRLIVLTHTHMDHCQNAEFLARQLQVPVAAAKEDASLIQDNMRQELKADTLAGRIVLAASLEAFRKDEIPSFEIDVFLKEGDSLEQYGVPARVISLPGHTDGSIGLDVEGALMNMFYPTVSMLYHDRNAMLESAEKISRLGERTIYFGHGRPRRNRNWR